MSDRFVYRLLCCCAFAAPWFFGLVSIGENKLALVDVLGPPLIACFLLRLSRPAPRLLQAAAICFCIATLLSVLQHSASADFLGLLLKVYRLASIFSPMLLASTLPWDRRKIATVLGLFFAGGGIAVGLGIVGFYFQLQTWTAPQTYYFDSRSYLRRAGGTFQDSGAFAHLLASWMVVGTGYLLYADIQRKSISILLSGLLAGGLALGLHTSLSRSAMVTIVLTILGLFLLPQSNAKRYSYGAMLRIALFLLVGILFVVVGVEGLPGVSSTALDRVAQTIAALGDDFDSANASSGNRLSNWRAAVGIWADRPFLGTGYKTLYTTHALYGDNNLILVLVETGVLGFAPFVILYGYFFCRGISMLASNRPNNRYLLVLWAGQLAHGATADTVTFAGSMPIMLVLATALSEESRGCGIRLPVAMPPQSLSWIGVRDWSARIDGTRIDGINNASASHNSPR